MSPGDMVVCGVSADAIIDDIGVNVPKGIAVSVSGDLTHRSRDLWRMLSQGLIFKCDVSNIVRGQVVTEPTETPVEEPQVVEELRQVVSRLQGELAQARNQQASLEADMGRLQAESARLRTELGEERIKVSKLDEILTLLQRQPLRSGLVSLPPTAPEKAPVVDDAPMYIPSQIKPSVGAEHPLVAAEVQSNGVSVTGAAQALRQVRRRGQ